MYLTLAWRNIWRNKRRSIITILSITFAVLLACIMRSMQLGSYERMIENAARFYTGYIQLHKNGYWDDKMLDNSFDFDNEVLAIVEETTGVEVAVPRLESFALASYGTKTKGAMVLGIVPEKEDLLTRARDKIVDGEYLVGDDRSVMIGQGLAKYLNLGVGDSLVLIGQGYHGANAAGIYPIKGIMKFPIPTQNNQTVYMPLKEAQWFYAAGNKLTAIALVVDMAKHVDRIVADISAKVDTETLEVMGWEELMPDLVQGIEVDNISGKVMIWILYIVIGFGMLGTFLMMTVERLYEFGVMISVGMTRLKLQSIILLEMLLMAGIGVLVGVGISAPIIVYYAHNPIFMSGEAMEKLGEQVGVEMAYFFSMDPALFYNQAWVIFFMALILGLYPLIYIKRLKPVDSMRSI